MDKFSQLRIRFAKTLCRMVDYGTGKEESPRPLKIAAVLLMVSASESLDELISDIYADFKSAAAKPLKELNERNIKDISNYARFLNSMGAISTSIVNFIELPNRDPEDEESALLIEFVKSLSNALEDVEDIGNSVNLRQGKNIYSIFEHKKLRDAAEKMLETFENNKVIELLEKKGAKDVAGKMERAKKGIERKIKYSEKLVKMKDRQGVPNIDPSKDVDLVTTAVA